MNFKLARDNKKPLVGSASHKINLEVHWLIHNTATLSSVFSSVLFVIKFLSGRLRSSAIVRNMNELKFIMNNETVWSEKHSMLKRFSGIRDPLMKACDDAGLEITHIGSEAFSMKVMKDERI